MIKIQPKLWVFLILENLPRKPRENYLTLSTESFLFLELKSKCGLKIEGLTENMQHKELGKLIFFKLILTTELLRELLNSQIQKSVLVRIKFLYIIIDILIEQRRKNNILNKLSIQNSICKKWAGMFWDIEDYPEWNKEKQDLDEDADDRIKNESVPIKLVSWSSISWRIAYDKMYLYLSM